MNKIYKYNLDKSGPISQKLKIPKGAILRCANQQNGYITLWFELESSAPSDEEMREFVIIGTGWPFNSEGLEYVNTVFIDPYVWHIYEKKS